MATLQGAAGSDFVGIIPDFEIGKIDIAEITNLEGVQVTEVAVADAAKDLSLNVGAEKPLEVKGESVSDSTVVAEAKKGETATVTFDTTKVTNTEIKASGEGSAEINLSSENVGKVDVVSSAAKGETAKVIFETKKTKKVDIVQEGEGSLEVSFKTGNVVGTTIKASEAKAPDSIGFGGNMTLKNNTIDTGKGADTVTFGDNVKLKGVTEIVLGKGKDVLEFEGNVKGKGKIVIKDFTKKDAIIHDENEIKLKGLKKGDDDLPDFLELEGFEF